MKKVICILIFVIVISTLCAEEKKYDLEKIVNQLKAAAMEEDDYSRHLMLDLILFEYGFLEYTDTEKTKTKWTAYDKTDPIDDSKVCYFILEADKGKNDYGDSVSLIIRASSEDVDLFINWNDYLGNDSKNYKFSEKDITIRIGKEEAETFRWSVSTDSKATFYPRDAVPLIRKLNTVNQFIAKCVPYNDSPTVAIFDVSGLKEVSMKYNDYLKWWEEEASAEIGNKNPTSTEAE